MAIICAFQITWSLKMIVSCLRFILVVHRQYLFGFSTLYTRGEPLFCLHLCWFLILNSVSPFSSSGCTTSSGTGLPSWHFILSGILWNRFHPWLPHQEIWDFFGVYDGHGGRSEVDYVEVQTALPSWTMGQVGFRKDTTSRNNKLLIWPLRQEFTVQFRNT